MQMNRLIGLKKVTPPVYNGVVPGVRPWVQCNHSGIIRSDPSVGMKVPRSNLKGMLSSVTTSVVELSGLPFQRLTELEQSCRCNAMVKS